ncbi:hypothetical protein [Pelomonas sp. KK5]|uniref:hypothetical protein n=1 Tax=Pelomonas sp. KK5 TaxID=1855730 RepID=UPI00097C8B0F|nr:hypothetical protein [Pelomonas sp. KK5]
MNEAILKWLASSTIGLVVCGSLLLAGTIQLENLRHRPLVGRAHAAPARQDLSVATATAPVARPAPASVVFTSLSLN